MLSYGLLWCSITASVFLGLLSTHAKYSSFLFKIVRIIVAHLKCGRELVVLLLCKLRESDQMN